MTASSLCHAVVIITVIASSSAGVVAFLKHSPPPPPPPAAHASDGSGDKGSAQPQPGNLAANSVQSQLQETIAGEVTAEDQAKLMASLKDFLKDQKIDLSQLSPAEVAKLMESLQLGALKDLKFDLKAMAMDAILDDAQTRMDSTVMEELRRKMEASAAGDLANRIAVKTDQALRDSKISTDKGAARDIVKNAMGDMKQEVQKQLDSTSLEGAAQPLTEKFMGEYKDQADRFQISQDELRQRLEDAIRKRLKEGFGKEGVDADAALTQLREQNHITTPEELAEAKKMADAAAQALENLKAELGDLNLQDMTKTAQELSAKGADLSAKLDKVGDAIDDAGLKALQLLSGGERNRAVDTQNEWSRVQADSKMEAVRNLVETNQRQSADNMKKDVEQGIDTTLGKLRQLSATIEGQQKALASAANAAPTPLPGEIADLKKKLAEMAKGEAQGVAGNLAQQAAGDVGTGGKQGITSRLNALAGVGGKFDQLAENAQSGRAANNAMALGMSNLEALSGGAGGAGGMAPGKGGTGVGGPNWFLLNAAALEKFGKDLRDRTNPDSFYQDVKEETGLASQAQPVPVEQLPALVFIEEQKKDASTTTAPVERKVPEPTFPHVAFAAAAMMEKPPVIDGDLSDWGDLLHPIPTRFKSSGEPVTEPTQVYFRWSPEGLYIAYKAKRSGPPMIPQILNHEADALEVWIDSENARRKQMSQSQTAQQFFFNPFGTTSDPKITFGEAGRGFRGLGMFQRIADNSGALGKAAARLTPEGYSVEAFISRKALAKPNLFPGAYLAMNFSVNRGDVTVQEQWSNSKAQWTWDKPDTWGDLLLLGSDAKSSFISFANQDAAAVPLVPGQPIAFQIQDKDMDLNPRRTDRVSAVLRTQGSDQGLVVILEETTPDSGIFRGSANTQPYYAPIKPNTLNIRGGDVLELVYTDARAEFGEANRLVTTNLTVATPVLRVAGRP